MNIVKIALEEKKVQVEAAIEVAQNQKSQIMIDRTKGMFAEAFDFLPSVEVSCRYGDSVYLMLNNKEILSIATRRYFDDKSDTIKGYLNTYSTMMESDFEMKRLIFNGFIARKFLNHFNATLTELFAPTGLEEELSKLQMELHQLQQQIRKVEIEEIVEKQKAMERLLKLGVEVSLSKLCDFKHGRGKWDYMHRIVKIKLDEITKRDANVIITCKAWSEDDQDRVQTFYKVKMKYIQDFIVQNALSRVVVEE